jgi:hypothetical protein
MLSVCYRLWAPAAAIPEASLNVLRKIATATRNLSVLVEAMFACCAELLDSSSEDESVEKPPPRKRTRRVKTLNRNLVESLDDNGNIVGLSPFQTTR